LAIRLLPILSFALIPACLLCFFISLADLREYAGIDLRPKMAGARMLAAGLDPYDMKLNPHLSEYFQTNNPPLYTPALLALYIPLSSLPAHIQRVIYFTLDWILALTILAVLLRYLCRTRNQRYLCWCIYAISLLCSYSFRMHLEAVQYYMILLLLTGLIAISLKNNSATWLACAPAALLILLRPTYGLVWIGVMLCLRSWKWSFRVALLAALLFAMTLDFGGVERWRGFGRVVMERQQRHLDRYSRPCDVIAVPRPPDLPMTIEGVDYSKYFPTDAASGTLIGIATIRGTHYCKWVPTNALLRFNQFLEVLTLALGVMVLLLAHQRLANRQFKIALILLWPMIFEIFGPERYFYAAVLGVLPLILVLVNPESWQRLQSRGWSLYLLLLIVTIGVVSPVVFQLLHQHRPLGIAVSIAILIGLPLCLALYCISEIFGRRAMQLTGANAVNAMHPEQHVEAVS
jgi:hypothetical protein